MDVVFEHEGDAHLGLVFDNKWIEFDAGKGFGVNNVRAIVCDTEKPEDCKLASGKEVKNIVETPPSAAGTAKPAEKSKSGSSSKSKSGSSSKSSSAAAFLQTSSIIDTILGVKDGKDEKKAVEKSNSASKSSTGSK